MCPFLGVSAQGGFTVFSSSQVPSNPTTSAAVDTCMPLVEPNHSAMGEYLVILASLTSFSASTQDSKGTVMSAMTAYVGPITTISGRKLPGESGMHCSTYRSPSESGIALTTLCRILLCLSLIRGAFGVQAFKICAMVSGADPHLRHVSFSILRALLATPFWQHSGLVGD